MANGDHSSPAVTADGVYVSYACEVSYRLNRQTGAKAWTHTTGCSGGGGSTPVVHDGKVYIRDNGARTVLVGQHGRRGRDPHLAAGARLPRRGRLLAEVNGVSAVNLATGAVLWTATGDGHLVTAPLVADGVVIVGSSTGKVFAFDEVTGVEAWSGTTAVEISGPDEWNAWMLAGLAVAESTVLVPASDVLVAYR